MLTIELSAAPATMRLVRKLVATGARIEGASELEAHLIEVAVGEVLAQRRAGSDNGASGSVTLGVELHAGRFVVSFTENIDTARQTDMPADHADDYGLGWGLYVIARVMDEVEIRRPVKTGQTPQLRLIKRIGWLGDSARVTSCATQPLACQSRSTWRQIPTGTGGRG